MTGPWRPVNAACPTEVSCLLLPCRHQVSSSFVVNHLQNVPAGNDAWISTGCQIEKESGDEG